MAQADEEARPTLLEIRDAMAAELQVLPPLGCFITSNGERHIMLDGVTVVAPDYPKYAEVMSRVVEIADRAGVELSAEVGDPSMYPVARQALVGFLAGFGFREDELRSDTCIYRTARFVETKSDEEDLKDIT